MGGREGTGGGAGPLSRPFDRDVLSGPVLDAGRELLGAVLEVDSPQGTVAVALSEVEAYAGLADPASHAFRGRTAAQRGHVRPGRLPLRLLRVRHALVLQRRLRTGRRAERGAAAGRPGRRRRGAGPRPPPGRPQRRPSSPAARPGWPARSASIGTDTGADLLDPASPIRLLAGTRVPDAAVRHGPRVGVAAAADVPWRIWTDGDPTVSPYRPDTRRRRVPT